MRHAKSDWSGDEPDRDRPIGKRGRRQAAEAGAWLAENVPDLERVVVSPSRRASETWEIAGRDHPASPPVEVVERVYTFDERDLLAVLRAQSDDVRSLLLVGHNPALDELVDELASRRVEMVTSALAVLRGPEQWGEWARGACELTAFGRPPADTSPIGSAER